MPRFGKKNAREQRGRSPREWGSWAEAASLTPPVRESGGAL